MQTREAIVVITAIFSIVAAGMAFFISYEEYAHHFSDRRKVLKSSLEMAVVTLVFFLVMGGIVAIVWGRVL